jgi:hypothetical protein
MDRISLVAWKSPFPAPSYSACLSDLGSCFRALECFTLITDEILELLYIVKKAVILPHST